MKLRIGKSHSREERAAAAEAVDEALRDARDAAVALVFSTEQYEADRLAAALRLELGTLPFAGCCTTGVIAGAELVTHGLAVGVLCGPDLRVGIGVAGPVSGASREAGREAVTQALANLPLLGRERHRALLTLINGQTGNPTEVIRGAAERGGAGLIWAGGASGDNLHLGRTAEFANGKAYRDHVVVIALDAPEPIGLGSRHGWRPLGPATLVTRSEGTRLIELDYERAFDVYRRTADEVGEPLVDQAFAAFAMMHPLGIPQVSGGYLIRDPLSEHEGALDCVGEVPEGSLVQLMTGERAELLAAANDAASHARATAGQAPCGAIVFDCFSRQRVFGARFGEELRTIHAAIGPTLPLVGCLTLGEVGALRGVPQFHNKTTVVLGV